MLRLRKCIDLHNAFTMQTKLVSNIRSSQIVCVMDRHTDGDQKRIIIETGSESQKYGIEISIQLDMERSIQGCMETDITK